MKHHAALREGKRHEDTDSIQIDKFCRIAIEDNQQETGQDGQEYDTDGKGKTVASEGELVRQEIITRQQRSQARVSTEPSMRV